MKWKLVNKDISSCYPYRLCFSVNTESNRCYNMYYSYNGKGWTDAFPRSEIRTERKGSRVLYHNYAPK